jgi:hypothetical protein
MDLQLPRPVTCVHSTMTGIDTLRRHACRREYNKRVKEVVEKSWIAGGADEEEEGEEDGKE